MIQNRGSNAKLVFLGDSITEAWLSEAAAVWQENFADYPALALGISGDLTQHLLWRISAGELDQLKPQFLVILIGVNNLGAGDSPVATLKGIRAVQQALLERFPDSRIIQLAILPADQHAGSAKRQAIASINQELAQGAQANQYEYLDLSELFLENQGDLKVQLMPDYLHPNQDGYKLMAGSINEFIQSLPTKKSR